MDILYSDMAVSSILEDRYNTKTKIDMVTNPWPRHKRHTAPHSMLQTRNTHHPPTTSTTLHQYTLTHVGHTLPKLMGSESYSSRTRAGGQ